MKEDKNVTKTTSSTYDLWLKGLSPNTAHAYKYYFDRILKLAQVTPDQLLEASRTDFKLYTQVKNLAKTLPEHGRNQAIAAIRSYLVENGIENLPPAHVHAAHRVKPSAYMTWEQAEAICSAASKPYNLIFKLMKTCGWGIGEFLKFNSAANWERVKRTFATNPNAAYFRFNYAGRKSNLNEFYTLIPRTLLQEIMGLAEVPIACKSKRNERLILDATRAETVRQYLESAWRTALKRAPVIVEGQPTVHELRDTFITRGTLVNCAREATQFVTGHTIDPLLYNKCFRNEPWVWGELSKIVAPSGVDEQRKTAILDNLRLLGYSEADIQDMVGKKFGHMTSVELLEEVQKYIDAKKQKRPETKPSMTNGGKAYDALLVDENDLVQYLEMGWELVSVINSKVAIRRPTH